MKRVINFSHAAVMYERHLDLHIQSFFFTPAFFMLHITDKMNNEGVKTSVICQSRSRV